MEYQDHLHFAGDWPEGERAIIERAVLKYESTIQQNAPAGSVANLVGLAELGAYDPRRDQTSRPPQHR